MVSDVASSKTALSIELPKVRLMTSISPPTPSKHESDGAMTSNESGSDVWTLGSRDLMSAESVGVYEDMYMSEKYLLTLSFDGIGPIAWIGRDQRTDVGHHQVRDCSSMFNSWSLSMTSFSTSS